MAPPALDPDFAALLGASNTQAADVPDAPAAPAHDQSATPFAPAAPSQALDPDFASLISPAKPDAAVATQSAPPAKPMTFGQAFRGALGTMALPLVSNTTNALPAVATIAGGGRLGPGNSAIVRPLYKAATALPVMAADMGVAARNIGGDAINKALGNPATADYDLPSSMIDKDLDSVTTAPQGPGKLAEWLSTAILSGKTPSPVGLNSSDAQAISAVPKAFATSVPTLPPVSGSAITSAQQAALAGGRNVGMRALPGQESGSVPLQQLEARLSSHPSTSGPIAALKAQNQSALNTAAAQAIGENTDTLDATALSRANDRLSGVFNNVRNSGRVVAADPAATSAAIDQIDQASSGLLPGDMSIRDNPLVKQLEGLTSTGSINGQQLGQLSSKLGKAAYKQMASPSGDRDLGQALYGVKDHVDDLVQSTLNPAEAADYAAARTQYRNLMTLTSRGNIVNPSTGNVSGVALANKLQQADKSGFLYGNNQTPMYQAARFAQAFKPIVGDSGTATRSASGHGGDLLSALGLGVGAHELGLPLHTAVASAALPWLAKGAANLGTRAYLTRPGAAIAQSLLSAPNVAGQAATLPWRAMAPAAMAQAPAGQQVLAPMANPGLLQALQRALGQ